MNHHHHPSSESGSHEEHDHAHEAVKPPAGAKYFCPMCPGVERQAGRLPEMRHGVGTQSRVEADAKTIYTCPMHPEIEQDHPGRLPQVRHGARTKDRRRERKRCREDNSELRDMTRRFWIGACINLAGVCRRDGAPCARVESRRMVERRSVSWGQFILSTPVVLWAGWPFFVRGARSLVNRSLNMFTLIALGVGSAWHSARWRSSLQVFPARVGSQRHGGAVFRSRRRHCRARVARTGAGTSRSLNLERHQSPA
jgi:Cu+-exporting ATPase